MSVPSEARATRHLLVALWGAGLVLFNFPMLIVWGREATVLGLPLLPVALFAIWAALIGALAWALERNAASPAASGGAEETGRPEDGEGMRTPPKAPEAQAGASVGASPGTPVTR